MLAIKSGIPGLPRASKQEKRKLELVKLLLSTGAKVNIRKKGGETPLMLAIEAGNPDLVRLLLKARAKVNIKKIGGDTPLMLAIKGGNPDIVKLLLDAGAKQDIYLSVGEELNTPFSLARTLANASLDRTEEINQAMMKRDAIMLAENLDSDSDEKRMIDKKKITKLLRENPLPKKGLWRQWLIWWHGPSFLSRLYSSISKY
jgi:ankyrin repeat protein